MARRAAAIPVIEALLAAGCASPQPGDSRPGPQSYSERYAGTAWSTRSAPSPATRHVPQSWLAVLLAVAFVVVLVAAAWLVTRGQDRLDASFGSGGIVTTRIVATASGPIADVGPAVLEPDGHIVVAGSIGFDFAIARYARTGRPDAGFGGDGLARTDVGGIGRVRGLALQPDGRILAVGEVWELTPGAPTHLVLARYLTDGDLDASFGSGGLVEAQGWSGPAAVAVQPDGRIVVAGTGLARFTADGWPDDSFGSRGLVEVPGSGLTAVAIQPDNRIVVAGDILATYATDGRLDPGFGRGGVAETSGAGGLTALALQPDGKIVVAGSVLARYTADGRLDQGFGSGGTVTVPGSGDLHAVALQPDGRIVLGGTAAGETGRFTLARCERDGTADPTFGTEGILTTEIGGQDGGVRALVIQGDGKIVAAGYRWSWGCSFFGCGATGVSNLLIARYDGH